MPLARILAVLLAASPVVPPGFARVKPVTPGAAPQARPAARLRIGSGRFFRYAMPEGWRVGEDGQYALTLVAPDRRAYTVMVGNSGLPPGYDPARYAHERLMATRPSNLKLGPGRPARPVAGFSQAVEFDVSYTAPDGMPCRGLAKTNVQATYGTAVYAMTAAISEASQWSGYSTWLPLVADQIAAKDGAAFGIRGVMAQNLANSRALGDAAARYRDWSEKNWKGVTDARAASMDRQREGMRENLGGAKPYENPFDGTRPPVDLPVTHRHYWMDRQGNVLGTDDPSANPNVGSTNEWRPMRTGRE